MNIAEQIEKLTEGGNGRIGDALQKELAERQEEQNKQVAKAVADEVTNRVSKLREYRRLEKKARKRLTELNEAITEYDSADNPDISVFEKIGVCINRHCF